MKSLIHNTHQTGIGSAIGWTILYFLLLLTVTAIDVLLWRNIDSRLAPGLNILTLALASAWFFKLLAVKTSFHPALTANLTVGGALLAVGCAVLFYLLLDKGIDPLLDSQFPQSNEAYQEGLATLRQAPVASFIRVCLIAPIVEELLMRGFILGGLQNRYGLAVSLLVSTILFGLLHFNMVQTLSALVCGLILGLLYIHTGALLYCIAAHSLYNMISYIEALSR